MRFDSVESLVAEFIELDSVSLGVRGQDPVALRQAVCSLCGGGPRTQVASRSRLDPGRRRARSICATCRQPWQGRIVELPKGVFSASARPHAVARSQADRISRLRELRDLLLPVPDQGWARRDWAFAQLAAFVRIGHGRSIPETADLLKRRYRDASYNRVKHWSAKYLREVVQRARARGMLAPNAREGDRR